jgi:hypothetical protein
MEGKGADLAVWDQPWSAGGRGGVEAVSLRLRSFQLIRHTPHEGG